MERGVYVAEFGGLTELAAIDDQGRVVRRVSILTELYSERDFEQLERWLESVSQRASALRLVR